MDTAPKANGCILEGDLFERVKELKKAHEQRIMILAVQCESLP